MKAKMKNSEQRGHQILQVSLTFDPAGLRLTRTPFGMLVDLEDCPISGEPGGPGLPAKLIRLALPVLARATGVSTEAGKTVRLTKKPELMAPLQLPQPGVAGKQPPTKRRGKKPQEEVSIKPSTLRPRDEPFVEPYPAPQFLPPRVELYKQEAERGRQLAKLVATEQVGPVRVVVIEVNPFSLTKDGLLEFAPEIVITLTYEQDDRGECADSSATLEEDRGIEARIASEFTRTIHSRAQAQRKYSC